MARVLLVDDDGDQLEIRKLICVHHGYIVEAASSIEEAANSFQKDPPDCIVMDLRLPKAEDGLALIRGFRASPRFTGRILVLSGFPGDIRGTPEAALVDAVLTKPVRSDALLRLIHG